MSTSRYYTLLLKVSFIFLFVLLCFQVEKLDAMSILNSLIIGIISALILALLLEDREKRKDKKIYGYLEGKYKRLARYHKNEDVSVKSRWKLKNDWDKDIAEIELVYKGNREYEIPQIHYDEQWHAKASLVLDPSNRRVGTGVYHYDRKSDSLSADFGTYQLFVDALNQNKIYLFHQNYVPSGLSEGYEVFERF